MKRGFVYSLFVLLSINIYAQNNISSMVKSMEIEDFFDVSISDENSSITFLELAEDYARIITDKNAAPEQLESIGNSIKMWMDTISEKITKDELFNEYSRVASTLSCMSIHLILRIAVKDNNIPTESEQYNIYKTINDKFIPSFAQFKNDGWKTEFNFYVINMASAVCKWYEDKSKKLDYPDFKVWTDSNF